MIRRASIPILVTFQVILGVPALPFLPGAVTAARAATEPVTRATVGSAGEECNASCGGALVAGEGRYVFWVTAASNLVPDDTNGVSDIFVRDRSTASTGRVSVSSTGEQANAGLTGGLAVSRDGRFVAFSSEASNLVPGDTNGVADVFVRDRAEGTTTRVSVSSSGAQANGSSNTWQIGMSANGRYLAFDSGASNLVSGDTNGARDVFVHDRATGTTTRVSVTSSGKQSQGETRALAISGNGNRLLFWGIDNVNLVREDTNGRNDVFVHDRTTGATSLVSLGWDGRQGDTDIIPYYGGAALTHDGRYAFFQSGGNNLIPGDQNFAVDIFRRDLSTGTTTLVSLTYQSSLMPDRAGAYLGSITPDGRYLAFWSQSPSLVPDDNNVLCSWRNGDSVFWSNCADVFVRDLATGSVTRASLSSSGEQGNGHSQGATISPDGRWVGFGSEASNLVAGDTNDYCDNRDADDDLDNCGDGFIRDMHVAIVAIPIEQTFGLGFGLHAINPAGFLSDPVNTATGSYVSSTTDIRLPGLGIPFEFTRSYTSADTSVGPLGIGWTHSYAASLTIDPNGDVLFRSEDGQQIRYTKQPNGSFIGPPGGLSRLSALQGGYQVLRKDQARYMFDAQGRLTRLEDRNGQGLMFSHGADGLLSTVTDSAGRVVTFSHNGTGRLTSIALPDGRTVGYGYTGGRLTSVTDPRAGTISYEYDEAARLSKVIDANGHAVVTNTYGPDGRLVEQADALGNTSTFDWDPSTETATMTDARGNEWKDVYSGNVLIRRIDPLGNATIYTRDANLNLTSVTDGRGNTTTMTYDSRGNLLTETAPAPLSYNKTFTYDSKNNLTSERDGRGNTVTYEYDAWGNLVKKTEPGSIVTQYGRDPVTGLLTSVTDPLNKTTMFDYDAQGNLIRQTSPLGSITTMGYDGSGRMTSRVDPRGNEPGASPEDYRSTFEYDASDRLVAQTDPLGNRTAWTHDPAGNLTSRTDAKGRTTSYGYDAANHLTSVTATNGTVTSYAYDEAGNLIRRTDAKLRVTQYGYDAANRLLNMTSPTGRRWTYGYDAAGNRVKVVNAAGNATTDPADGTITYQYDVVNRVVAVDYSDATPDVQYTYDANDNRTSMTDGMGTESYTYDPLNRLTGISRGNQAFSYAYDATGNLTRRTYPDSTVVDPAYDDDGRLASVTSGGATTTYVYDAAGNLIRTTLPASNGYVETRTYDRAGRLTEVLNAAGSNVLSRFTYTLDPVGNPTTVTGTEGTTTFSYDSLDRLTEACFAVSCPGAGEPFIRFTYDEVGNRLTEARNTGTTTYSYNAADQLTSRTGPGGSVSYAYDPNGNQTVAGGQTFTYDLAGRMASAKSGNTTTTYTYDGDGKRLQASSGSQASKKTNYLWDPNAPLAQLVREADGNGALLRRYLHGQDLISMTSSGSDYFFHYDRLGSVANLTSSTGALQWTYSYEPFGTSRSQVQHTPGAPTNLMRFTGELFDVGTGLYHLRARQYDATIGRFLQIDPATPKIADPYVAAYVYVNNRPAVFVDPSGEIPFLLVLGIGALIGAGANTAVYGVSVAVDDKKAWSWKGALAAGLEGGIAGATTAATWGLGIPALPAAGVNFAGGAFGAAAAGSICGDTSTGSILGAGLFNAAGGQVAGEFFPKPVGKHVAPQSAVAQAGYAGATGSAVGAGPTAFDSCGNAVGLGTVIK